MHSTMHPETAMGWCAGSVAWTEYAFLRGPSPFFGGDQARMGLSSGALKMRMFSGYPFLVVLALFSGFGTF